MSIDGVNILSGWICDDDEVEKANLKTLALSGDEEAKKVWAKKKKLMSTNIWKSLPHGFRVFTDVKILFRQFTIRQKLLSGKRSRKNTKKNLEVQKTKEVVRTFVCGGWAKPATELSELCEGRKRLKRKRNQVAPKKIKKFKKKDVFLKFWDTTSVL